MKTHYLILAFILLFYSCKPRENWIQLFNGKDLNGWDIKFMGNELNDNYLNTFYVEDGILKVDYKNYSDYSNKFGHIFYNEPFSSYKLRVEYRFVGDQCPGGPGWAFRNNGIMIHSQSAASMGLDQNFPVSLEVQLLGGNGTDERPNANVCTPGTTVDIDGVTIEKHCINSTSKTYHGDQWVTMEVIVYEDSIIHHILEGDTVLTYTNPRIGGGGVSNFREEEKIDGTALKKGYISLQAESHPTEFRKIELLRLEK